MKNFENSLQGTNTPKLNDYKEWLEKRNLTPQTIRIRLWGVEKYNNRELNTDNVVSFLKENLTKYQPHGLKSLRSCLSSYASFLKVEIEWDLIIRLIPEVQKKFYDTINERELTQLKSAEVRVSKEINERDNLMLDFLFYTGIRISELLNIRHCDYQNRSLRIHGKGNKVRFIFVPDFLTKYFNGGSNFLFQTRQGKKLGVNRIRMMIYLKNKKAGINKHITPHSFRRSFATLLNNREVKLTTIQRLLGHSNINTTTTYIHNSYEELYKDYSKLWEANPIKNIKL
jgi:integrase